MNVWPLAGMLATLLTGYFVGWTHGNDRAAFDARPAVAVVSSTYPYADVCAEMLDAAWSIGPAAPPSPHD